jgi:hypothetical protein
MNDTQRSVIEKLNAEIQASGEEAAHKVGEYLIDRAGEDPAAAAAISAAIASGKTLNGAWERIYAEARKVIHGGRGAVPDATVFGWACGYYGAPVKTGPTAAAPKQIKRVNMDLDALLS